MPKILLVDDDREATRITRDVLEALSYTVEAASDGEEGLYMLENYRFDAAVVDWQMPKMSGVDMVKGYRAAGGQIPILMLTGLSKISDKETGFECGADDYLTKPFEPRELLMRLKALLRRPPAIVSSLLVAGPLRLDPSTGRAWVNDSEIFLLHQEFAVLEYLMRHPGQIFGVDDLLNAAWKSTADSTETAVRTVMSRLRKKLEAESVSCITTVRGFGYKLEA